MKLKKAFSALAVWAVVLSGTAGMLPEMGMFVPASVLTARAKTYEGLMYAVLDDGTVKITDCDESLTSVEVPGEIEGKAVTSIEGYAFRGCTNLTDITIPDSVTSVGSYAFRECTSLTNIVIPDSVTSIGSYAFRDCTSLTNITIPDSVTSIESATFYGCTSLADITISNSVTTIGGHAFRDCTRLTNITILNPHCEIYDEGETICNSSDRVDYVYTYTGTITGYTGSTAQAYAERYGYDFVSLGEAPTKLQYGDADESGEVDIGDVIALCKASMGTFKLTEQGLLNGDVDGDGKADTTDAAYILQSLIGLFELPN